MKSELIVVAESEVAYGFKLAGVGKMIVAQDGRFSEYDWLLEQEGKVILVSSSVKEKLSEHLEQLRKRNIVQEIPCKDYKGVRDLIKDTIGFDVHG